MTFDYEQHTANFEHRGQIAKYAFFVGKVMQRVVTNDRIKFSLEGRGFDVVRENRQRKVVS